MGNFLKNIARQPTLVRITEEMRIGGPLRGIYRFCFAPDRGKHQVCVAGHQAQFYVYSQAAAHAFDLLGGERPTLEHLIEKLTSGDCFWDVGAATGLYTIFLARVVGEKGQVVAFEPELDSYTRLRENVRLNCLENVRPFQMALSDHDGFALLQTGDVSGVGRITESGGSGGTPARFERVTTARGDGLVARQGLPSPRAVKVDVEGHEHSVLQGLAQTLSQPTCELICCEVHLELLPQDIRAEDILTLLCSFGFMSIEIHPRTRDLHVWASKRKAV